MIFLDPTSDIAFKKLFGNSEHKNILISFLNSELETAEEKGKTKIAKKLLLKTKMSVQEIAELTDLSVEEIKKIKSE